ncbi:MAG: D-alanyl-D-alanine carboxypeptidase/D-alanyl-D-alanine endopeptidase [Planctomycetota bacterium]
MRHPPKVRPSWVLGGVCLVAVAVSGQAPTASPAGTLDALVSRGEAGGVRTGVVVLDVRARKHLYQHRSQEAFIPASNQKLLTAAAVMLDLGPQYRFRTVFRVRQGVLEVTAAGDPNWQTGGAHDPGRIFARVAARLRAAGVARLREVRLRAGRFTGPIRPDGWPRDQLHRAYCAGTAGLVADAGCFVAEVRPGTGKRAEVAVLAPRGSLPVTGGIKVVRKRGARFGLRDAGGRLVAHGSIYRKSKRAMVRGPLRDPSAAFGLYLRHSLDQAGIRFDAEAPAVDREVLVYETQLREALPAVLRDSSNFHAEQLLRVLGAEREEDGSYAGGVRALRARLEALVGKLPANVRLVDGSGLSRDNRLTPELIGQVLQVVLCSRQGKEFVRALAQGRRSGTLKKRFRGCDFAPQVFAKTGTIDGVSCLSGVLTDTDGRLMVFAVCMNTGKPGKRRTMRKLQEEIVAAIWNRADGR